MKKGRNLVFVILILGLLTCIVGTSVAYMFRHTDEVKNLFEPALVDCVIENGTVSITNTGTIDAYLRIRIVTYWENSDKDVADKPSPTLSVSLADGWVAGSDNTYYYSQAVVPGVTVKLLRDGQTITPAVDNNDNTRQIVKVFGEAIQSQPAAAATSAWGVTISNARITNAP